MRERKVTVRLNEGLHARPATQFVKLARGFVSDIEVLLQGKSANAKSAVKLMLLGVKENDEIFLRANGADESEAIEQLSNYASKGEVDPPSPAARPQPAVTLPDFSLLQADGVFVGAAASAGAAIGPVFLFLPATLDSPRRALPHHEIEPELERLEAAMASVEEELTRRSARAAAGSPESEIIKALTEIGRDIELVSRMKLGVREGLDAVNSALESGAELAKQFQALADPYMQARAEDIYAFARQVALALLGKREASLAEAPKGAIVLADDISAFDLAGASLHNFAGLVSLKGGPTSHVAIIARSYGVPAVLGLDVDPARLARTRIVALDGASGEVALDPDATTTENFRQRIEAVRQRRAALAKYAQIEPRTRDGRLIEIGANLGSLKR